MRLSISLVSASTSMLSVSMALCSGTLRRYLEHHKCLPDESLIAMVPVSVRSGSEDEAYQWLWSKHLALSYYSKPPMIAMPTRGRASCCAWPCSPWPCGFSSSAASAGDSVSETKQEIAVEAAMVTANCW